MSEASSSSLPASAHASAKRALAARLAETMRGTAHEADVSGTANMLYELLLIVHSAQVAYGRQRARVNIKHRILHAAESETLTLEINHVDVLGTSELEALRRFAGANYGSTRFEFRSPATDELLSHGRVVLRLGVVSERRASESDGAFDERQRAKRDALAAHYAAPDARRAQTMQIDWRTSVVAEADRPLVLELIGDIYNMHQIMPTNITLSLEPIERTDYQSATRAKRKARPHSSAHDGGDDDDDETQTTSAETDAAACVGYALHFANVPSFTDSVLAHLQHKFASRWLGATVLFPHKRHFKKSGTHSVPPQLIVSLRAQHAGVQAKAYQVRGAKRACKKIEKLVQ